MTTQPPMHPFRRPLDLVGPTGHRVRLPGRLLLAPMEGVTDRAFRDAVLDLGGVGAASTEFLRVHATPIPTAVIRRELGPVRDDVPVAVQLMASGPEQLLRSVQNAEQAGAAWVDLNFGCPVKRIFGRGAGSALLDEPELLGSIVRAAVEATELPVSAKLRVGVNDDSRLRELVTVVAESGAAMLALHARRRIDGYSDPANWSWLTEAAALWHELRPGAPFVGNGGVDGPEAAQRMIDETDSDAVMVGRAALVDPFLFRRAAGGEPGTAEEAARFVLRYLAAIDVRTGGRNPLGRVKQLVKYLSVGDLFERDPELRARLLRARKADELRDGLSDAIRA